MLEVKIDALTDAVKELTGVMRGGASAPAAAAAPGKSAAAGKKAEAAAPMHTAEEVKKAAIAVRDALGAPVAQKLITEHGKAAKLADVKPAQFTALVTACNAALAEAEANAAAGEDDGL